MDHDPVRAYRSAIDDLAALRAYVAVIDEGSFSKAGRRLGVAPSTISKHVVTLEQRLRAQLIVRSTKRLHVTELGRGFHERCLTILHECRLAEEEVGGYNAEPQGLLKVTVPATFGPHQLSGVLCDFLARYPRVRLDVTATTETLDLIDAGIDVAIRISSSLDTGLIAVPLAANTRVYCAAPAYLAHRGTPASVADLADHNCVVTRGGPTAARWPMTRADGSVRHVTVSGNFVSDSGDMVINALLAGLGVGYVARFRVHDDLVAGRLVALFPGEQAGTSHIHAVYSDRRHLPMKTRAFIDHLRAHFATPAAWAT